MDVATRAQTGVGQSTAIRALAANPFNVGFGVVVSGTVTYTVEHTFNGVNFFPHEFVAGVSINADGNYAYPVAGIRLNVTAGDGTATLTTIQAR